MAATAVAANAGDNLRNNLIGFGLGAAFFVGVDGFLIGNHNEAAVVGALAGALIGAFLGAGLVLLAWRPRAQDAGPRVDHGDHPRYMLIWGALFVMTLIEVGVAFLAFSKVMIVLALVFLAVWKALLVALYYMHLKFEPRRLWLLAASPIPLAFILVLTVLTEGW